MVSHTNRRKAQLRPWSRDQSGDRPLSLICYAKSGRRLRASTLHGLFAF